MNDQALRIDQVRRMVGNVSKPTIYNWIHTRKFPPPIRIGGNVAVWRLEYVRRWISDQERAAA